jgi:hypothetical protein
MNVNVAFANMESFMGALYKNVFVILVSASHVLVSICNAICSINLSTIEVSMLLNEFMSSYLILSLYTLLVSRTEAAIRFIQPAVDKRVVSTYVYVTTALQRRPIIRRDFVDNDARRL